MPAVKKFEQSLTGLAGKAGKFFRSRNVSGQDEIELAGVDVLRDRQPVIFPESIGTGKPQEETFNIGAILRLRTFLYLIAATALFLFQIHNTLTIKELAKQNERLREQLRISTSIRTAQELKASELQSIHNISGYAQALGLSSSAVPPVDIEH